MYQTREFSLSEININIFKEYDIRGKIGKELNPKTAYRLGQLFAYNVNKKQVIIAKDNRESSKILLEYFRHGLIESGCKVIELEGVSTSPYLYFASWHLKSAAAVIITGSHNSVEENGFKFMLNNKPFFGKELRSILNNPIIPKKGDHKIINLEKEYIASISKNISFTKASDVVWECNNSGNEKFISKIRSLNNTVLNGDTLGKFKHNFPDPFKNPTLSEIKSLVGNHDFGFAFDGDGDRLVMIKKNGNVFTSDQLIYIFAKSLEHNSNKKIIVDTKVSQVLINRLQSEGFKVIIAPPGHSLMKTRIIEEDAVFAGESSGHFIFNDKKYLPIDDALYAALRLIEYLAKEPLIELPLAKVRHEFRLPKIKWLVNKVYSSEGLRYGYKNSFLLIRASNTEDYILVKYEISF